MYRLTATRAHRRLQPVVPREARAENFPVALRVLPVRTREHLYAVYRYARYVDDIGDESPADRESALLDVAADVRRLYAGDFPTDEVVAGLHPVVRDRGVPMDPFLRLVEANLQDQRVSRYDTFEDLLGYCALSANPVGEVVLHVFGRATPDRVALSDRVCTALQLIEHWQDVAEDYRAGRIYLPGEDLRRFGVPENDLGGVTASPALTALLGFETDRALAWLDSGAVLVSTLRGWSRLAVSGYVAGGRAAAVQLRRAGHDSLAQVPKPSARDVAGAWLRATVRS
ncbi:MAG: squalene synthase HpnC, partial [Nocardioidaceae bacterium]